MLPFLQPPPPPPENVERPVRTLEGHQQQITGLVYSNGKLYSSSYDLTIKEWDVSGQSSQPAPNTRTFIGHSQNVLCLEKLSDKLYSGSLDNTLREWDIETGVEVRNFVTDETRAGTMRCLHGDTEQDIIFSGTDALLQEWDIKSGKVSRIFEGHTGWIRAICSDGAESSNVFSAGYDKSIKMWDRGTGKLIDTLPGHERPVSCLIVSSGMLYSGGQDNRMKVWDLTKRNLAKTFIEHKSHVNCMCGSATGSALGGPRIFSGCQDRVVREWDTEQTPNRIVRNLNGHPGWVKVLAIGGPDRLYSGGTDNQILEWDITPLKPSKRKIAPVFGQF